MTAFTADVYLPNGRLLSDCLADDGHVWTAPNDSDVDSKTPSASMSLRVTRVMEDGVHFWARFEGNGADEDELLAELDPRQVCIASEIRNLFVTLKKPTPK